MDKTNNDYMQNGPWEVGSIVNLENVTCKSAKYLKCILACPNIVWKMSFSNFTLFNIEISFTDVQFSILN